jgi:hypothetical protein
MARDINEFRNLTLIRKAAGDVNGEINFSLASAQFDAAGTLSVPVVRLDDALRDRERPIRFMKIDIEGAEYRALVGAESLIRRDQPKILIELFEEMQRKVSRKSVYDLLGMLAGWGYRVETLAGEAFSMSELDSLVKGNVVFNVILIPA